MLTRYEARIETSMAGKAKDVDGGFYPIFIFLSH